MNEENEAEVGGERLQQPQVQIQLPPDVQRGVYANQVHIAHTQEEFVLDFILSTPPAAVVNARVVLSPGHANRLVTAMKEVIAQYEQQYGAIRQMEPASVPPGAVCH